MFKIRMAASWPVFVFCALALAGCGDSGNDQVKIVAGEIAKTDMVERRLGALALQFGAIQVSDERKVFEMLRAYLEENPDIYGAAYAFAPVELDGVVVKSSPYVFRGEAGFVERDLAVSYDYVSEQWYSQPVERGMAVWSDPYFDEGGGDIWMVTYSVPVYDGDSRLSGVLTSDLPAPEKRMPSLPIQNE
ncbi:cache domain-containing protein [Porticoccus sp.]